jgi:hypothetical protein
MANFVDQDGVEDIDDDTSTTLWIDQNGVFLGIGAPSTDDEGTPSFSATPLGMRLMLHA